MNHELLDNLVDYAGLFPPASLGLSDAVEEYAGHQAQPEAWMLGRFICPVARLDELHAFGHMFEERTLSLCVLPTGTGSLRESIEDAVNQSDRFVAAFAGRTSVDVFEARAVRSNTPDSAAPAQSELRTMADLTGARQLYLEWPATDADLGDKLATLAEARAAAGAATGVPASAGARTLGAKIRCGGVGPQAFPTVNQVSSFIHLCVQLGVPFKATAGLHHPLRHVSGIVTMHGFLNVFGAAVLAKVHDLDLETVQAIVGEMNPEAFDLANQGLAWRQLSSTREQVQAVRLDLAHSYGSCSFDDPTNDLKARDWFQSSPRT